MKVERRFPRWMTWYARQDNWGIGKAFLFTGVIFALYLGLAFGFVGVLVRMERWRPYVPDLWPWLIVLWFGTSLWRAIQKRRKAKLPA